MLQVRNIISFLRTKPSSTSNPATEKKTLATALSAVVATQARFGWKLVPSLKSNLNSVGEEDTVRKVLVPASAFSLFATLNREKYISN